MFKFFNKLFIVNVKNCRKDRLSALVCTRNIGTLNNQARNLQSRPQEIIPKDDIISNTNVESSEDANESIRLQKIRRAMQLHLKKLQEEVSAKEELNHEFEIGRRHLANMMGADPNTFDQNDINKAIEYLMPSGLFEPKARPVMKPPDELSSVKDGVEVDDRSRPENMLFYTGRGKFYTIFHNISSNIQELNNYEDKMIRKGFAKPPAETKIFLGDSEWINLSTLKTMVVNERIMQHDYDYLIESLERLVEHPYSFRVKEFIMKYRKSKMGLGSSSIIPPLTVGEDGVPYSQAMGKRKRTMAQVTVRGKGSGQVDIGGWDISYFSIKQDREQLLFPLKFSGLLNQVDIEARLSGEGGHTAEAGAIRNGLAIALCSFVNSEAAEQMRMAGLLSWDRRTKERKKPGQKGARAKYKWRKR